ncbi:MAG: hypothetical protein GTO63_10375 [Anaerolineae bacterium]|nr:hypothetical protein [Anaerolineae bacterium]NIN95307.1 hypothetical protein [Anaerolineae bacterium]NIQ78272.1 hypothetical protein [Anaerolineae bacterium]
MRSPRLALACVAVAYVVLAFLVLPRDAFFSSDEGLKFIQLQNFVRKGWRDFTLDYPGRGLDPDLRHVPINNPPPLIQDGRIYAVYPVFFPLVATPLYRLLGYAGLYVIPLTAGLLTLVITYQIARLAGGGGPSSIVVLGLCSPLIFYSLVFWDHTLGTLLATLALLLVVSSLQRPRRLFLLLGGVVIGLGIWVRSELYVMAIAMPLALLLLGTGRLTRLVWLCLGILGALVPLWLFQFVVYGDFIGPHVSHVSWLSEQLPATTDRVAIVYHTLLEGNSSPAMSFLYIMAFAASALLVRAPRIRTSRLLIIIAFATLVLATIPNLIEASRGRPLGGLITTAPFLVFGFATLLDSSVRRCNAFLLALSIAYIALVSLLTPVDPGLQWGARFLLPVLPPLAVLATNNFGALRTLRGRSTSGLLGACFVSVVALSFFVQLSGLRTLHIIKTTDQQLIRDTAQIDPIHILSDEWGYAEYVAPLFYEKQFFFVRDQAQYEELTQTLLENDTHTFAVVTYPRPRRRVVDPLIVADGYAIRKVGEQVYEIGELDSAR